MNKTSWSQRGRAAMVACLAALCALTLSAPARSAPDHLLAPKSGLPYPDKADIWADAVSVPAVIPDVGQGVVTRARVLVFRPAGDDLTWDQQVKLCTEAGLLEKDAQPRLTVARPARADSLETPNSEDLRLYVSGPRQDRLTLGQVRNVRTQHLLCWSVLLTGTLNNAQAAVYSRQLVNELAESERVRRLTFPAFPGAVPAGATTRIAGAALHELLEAIEENANISDRVKDMARAVVPQATSISLSTWRSAAPIADQSFLEFYTREANRLGWGPPVSRDESQPERPTLLFQRPNNEGVVMVRAQPTAGGPLVTRASTTIFVLVMEGKIDAGSLRSKP